MPAKSPAKLGFDADWADGSLEMLELTYDSVIAYHAGWHALHSDDQREFLATCATLNEPLQLLNAWHKGNLLDPEQLLRLAEIQARQLFVESLIRSLNVPLPAASNSNRHPMVLDE